MSDEISREDLVWRFKVDSRLEKLESSTKENKDDISKLDEKFDDYTHIYQFIPVRNIAYGLVTSFGVGIIGALIAVITTTQTGLP